MPANSPYPGESQEQFAMRQGEQSMNPMAGEAMPGSYAQPQDDGGAESIILQAIAQRFPDVQPDKLDEIYQAWLEFSEGQGGQPDLEQFFQQYEADAQGFGGREAVNKDLPPELVARIQQGQGQQGPPMGGQYT